MISIVRVLAPNPGPYTLEGTNTWILGREPSIVIDPGPDLEEHLSEVAAIAGEVSAVVVTHDHPDHAPGAPRLARKVGAPLFAARLGDAEPLRDGAVVQAGEVELVAVATPGHTSDHFAFHLPIEGAVFTGDAILGRGTSFIDPPGGDLVHYLRSLERLRDLSPRTIYPGHGPVVLDAPAKIEEYIEHRAEREAQILDELGTGPKSIADIVVGIYADYPEDVRPLAARSVLAHLLKLEGEGRVAHKGTGEAAVYAILQERACKRCGRPVRGHARYCGPCSLALLQDSSEGSA